MQILIPYTQEREFEITPEGAQAAICYGIAVTGTHQTEYMGESKTQKTIRFVFELHGDTYMADGRPFSISQEYTLSLNEKANLRKFLQGWRGKAYSDDELKAMNGLPVDKMLGMPAMLNIGHKVSSNGKTYANILSIMPVPKGMPVPAQINESYIFTVDQPNDAQFAKLPKYIQDKCLSSMEMQRGANAAPAKPPVDAGKPFDDIPPWLNEEPAQASFGAV